MDWFGKYWKKLRREGINYRQNGCKLKDFLKNYDILEVKSEPNPNPGHTPVCFARVRENMANSSNRVAQPTLSRKAAVESSRGKRKPNAKMELCDWASIADEQIEWLATKFARKEKWYYGSTQPTHQKTGTKQYPLLSNYLNNTFKRLCHEDKIKIIITNKNEEYAAFNTGLVNGTYQYIYALFEPNHNSERQYWILKSFVVNGERDGKILNSSFESLPEKASYLKDMEDVYYDTAKILKIDYDHIFNRIDRFPIKFLKNFFSRNPEFLIVDGVDVDIDTAYQMSYKEEARINYFTKLVKKIKNDPEIFNELRNRVEAAKDLAVKRVERNYRTAIPMYYPRTNSCSLLLPLALVNKNLIDLALVVARTPVGNYQGETVLPLNLAYSNSRLITIPDSDWLRMDSISEDENVIDNND